MEVSEDRHSALKVHLIALLGVAIVLFLAGCESPGGSYGPGAGNFHTVIVDAGHGGHDQGARAVSGSYEKDLALDTSRRLARVLRAKGLRVIETRTSDYFIPLGGRTDISNRTGGAIFVSVHYNWDKRRAARGIETYYYSARSRRLAANILREIKQDYPTKNRGVKYNSYYVLHHNRKPAVLCELGFLSNPEDNSYLQNSAYRQKLAEGIAAGIMAEKRGRNP